MNRLIILSGGLLALASTASADLLVDRGLPTANLNNAAGVDRSNVAWLFTGYTTSDYWLVGDTFANTGSQTWNIDSIRVWTMKATDSAVLWGGIAGSSIGVVSPAGVVTDATYVGGVTYQGSSGTYRDIHQVDFAVSITLAPGQTFQFFLDGYSSDSGYTLPFVHASNAARSGSLQEGADDTMLYANVLGGAIAPGDVGTWTSLGNGWDKASDVNVQVFGTVPDLGSTSLLFGMALGCLGWVRRRN